MEVPSMSLAPDAPGTSTADPPTVADANRRALSEDWLATLVGLILIALVLAGIVTDGLIP
jgi:hypothetical protein